MLKLPPGGITGEFQAPPLAVDVCDVESLLVHVTVPPTETVIGLGLKAVVVIVDAPMTIDAATLEPEGDVVVEGVDGEDEVHAAGKPSRAATSATRIMLCALVMDTVIASVLPRLMCPAQVYSQSNAGGAGKDELRDLGAISWRVRPEPPKRTGDRHGAVESPVSCRLSFRAHGRPSWRQLSRITAIADPLPAV
jgi:hypothetical protein